MQDNPSQHKIPDYVLMPYYLIEGNWDLVMNYNDGQAKRRARREQQRKNKKR